MATKYPLILVHGIMLKDWKFVKAFGNIQNILTEQGYMASTAPTDGFGSIETNAHQLQAYVLQVLEETGQDKVNLICHSKGGLDARYMIQTLDMADKVASVTFLCTPHKGSQIATKLYALPKPLRGLIAWWLTLWYRIFGDQHPEVLKVCCQLSYTPEGVPKDFDHHDGIFMQSYATTMKNARMTLSWGFRCTFQDALKIAPRMDLCRWNLPNLENIKAFVQMPLCLIPKL